MLWKIVIVVIVLAVAYVVWLAYRADQTRAKGDGGGPDSPHGKGHDKKS